MSAIERSMIVVEKGNSTGRLEIPNAPPAAPALSVSTGLSVYPEDGRSAADLLEAADRRLYKRKKAAHEQGVTAGQH